MAEQRASVPRGAAGPSGSAGGSGPAPTGTAAGPGPERAPYTLLDREGRPRPSDVPGTLGGHSRSRLYGRLDCPSALRALARGGYREHRVFFADARTARAAGYRPCAVCLPLEYAH